MQGSLSQSVCLKARQPSPNKSKDLSMYQNSLSKRSVIVHAQSKSMLLKMKNQNIDLSHQLITQKTSNAREDIVDKINLEKLRLECQNYAQNIEGEQIKREELQLLIQSYQKDLSSQTIFENDQSQKTNQQYKHLEQRFQQLKQSLNLQKSQISNFKEELNIARRERVIHSTVVKAIESDIKQKSNTFMKLIKKKEISDVQLKVYKEEMTSLMCIIQQGDIYFEQDSKQALYDVQMQSEKSTFRLSTKNDESLLFNKICLTEQQENSIAIVNSHLEENELIFLQEAFQKVFNQTSVTSVHQLMNLHEKIDEQNEDLYLDVINTTTQIEKKQQEINDIDNKILYLANKLKIKNENSSPVKLNSQKEIKPSQRCDQLLEKNKDELDIMKNNLMTIADEIDFPDMQEKQNEVTKWNLNIFANEVVEKCRQIIMICDMIELPVQQKVDKPIGRKIKTSVISQSSFVIGTGRRQDKQNETQLDDLLLQLDKIKSSETIFNREDFQQHGHHELKKKDKKPKIFSKKQITQK